MRWLRGYALAENDGKVGALCVLADGRRTRRLVDADGPDGSVERFEASGDFNL